MLAELRHITKPKSDGEVEERKKKDRKRRAELTRV
jgi:hypothetical protein